MYLFRRLLFCFSLSVFALVFTKTVEGGVISHVNNSQTIIRANEDTSLIIIRFDYKQSALYHPYTLGVLDSVVTILRSDKAITVSIDGYAFKDEGTDTVCFYLSQNRALFIQTYLLGRGVDSSRIRYLKAHGKVHEKFTTKDENGFLINVRADLRLIFPPKPQKPEFLDRDEDGIEDRADRCPDNFGIKELDGCPDSAGIVVPFGLQESSLNPNTYSVMDSIVGVLKSNPSYTISIGGHACLAEGVYSVCQHLASERAEIVKLYMISRQISPSRILAVKNYGVTRPVNTAKTPQDVLKNTRAEIRINR